MMERTRKREKGRKICCARVHVQGNYSSFAFYIPIYLRVKDNNDQKRSFAMLTYLSISLEDL